MFIYDKNGASNLRFQITQETSLSRKFTSWGQANAKFSDELSGDIDQTIVQYRDYQSTNLPRKPWSDLYQKHDVELLEKFDGWRRQGNVTSSGLIVDEVIYQKPCQTRFGDFPYCREMRHGVFSVTKSMGAAVSLARLARKYGDQVLQEKILDHVDIRANHDGWKNVTFKDALNMATGIGDIFPERVNFYVDGDESEAAGRVFRASTVKDKLRQVSRHKNYPWGPGEVLRYRTTDTFVLSVAMDRYLKSKEGKNARLWDMMNKEVYQPIGIRYLPSMHTTDRNPLDRAPKLGYQLYPTVDDIAKVVRLLRNEGMENGVQILSSSLVSEMFDLAPSSGLPSNWSYREGGEARYGLSFWLIPYSAIKGCSVVIPAMVGVGGNYVIPMSNGITTFRFADRYDDHEGTYDSYHMRRLSDSIKSVCYS